MSKKDQIIEYLLDLLMQKSLETKKALNQRNAFIDREKNLRKQLKLAIKRGKRDREGRIFERMRSEKFEKRSLTDHLTGLGNRRKFEQDIKSWKDDDSRKNELAVVFMIDADYFKRVNDTYGHDMGDRVLIELSLLLKKLVRSGEDNRPSDEVYRWGGEEMILLGFVISNRGLVEISLLEQDAAIAANRICKAVDANSVWKKLGLKESFTVSIGFKVIDVSISLKDTIAGVDEALYLAKKTGRNRAVPHSTKNPAKLSLSK